MEEETLYNILTGQYGEILETHAMWECIASLGIKPFKDGNMWCYLYGELKPKTIGGVSGFFYSTKDSTPACENFKEKEEK